MKYTIEDLLIAYKKVKNDIYHDKSNISIIKILDFEENLLENIENLLSNINTSQIKYFNSPDFLGGINICFKSVEINNNKKDNIFVSDLFEEELDIQKINYRFIGDNSIEFQILGSLWIDKIGIHLEKNISENSYGCRLDRPFQKENNFANPSIKFSDKDYKKLDSHFRPYFLDYKKWQENSLKQIEKSLEEGKQIAVLTTDIQGFYHSIDPEFLIEYFEYNQNDEIQKHHDLNYLFCECLINWSDLNREKVNELDFEAGNHVGIPIGLSASKVIANLFLNRFDKEIENSLTPIFYGRYVDDIIIVIENKTKLKDSKGFWQLISKKIQDFHIEDVHDYFNEVKRTIYFSPDSLIEHAITLNSKKEKIFILKGRAGKTFIDTIKETMNKNSSEWRLLPDSEEDIDNINKEVTSCNTNSEDISGLRKADGVSIKRLKFALSLRNFENFTQIAPHTEWKAALEKFIDLCSDFILTPENLAIYLKYIPRIFGLTISVNRIDLSDKLFISYNKTLGILKEKDNNSVKLLNAISFLDLKIYETMISNINIKSDISKQSKINKYFSNYFNSIVTKKDPEVYAIKLFFCDLHTISFKSYLLDKNFILPKSNSLFSNFFILQDLEEYNKLINMKLYSDFFENTRLIEKFTQNDGIRYPNAVYFSTRKFNSLEISLIYPYWSTNIKNYKDNFLKYLNLFNIPILDLNINDSYLKNETSDSNFVLISFPEKKNNLVKNNPKLVLTNFQTNIESWCSIVRGDNYEPDNSRFTRLNRIINDILKESSRSKIKLDYIILPELSVPRNCILDIAKKLKSKGISLIAGVEYEITYTNHDNYRGSVSNQLLYILNVSNGKYNDQVALIQDKTIPAIHEESDLFNVGGMRLNAKSNTKYIIDHNNFFFSALICNDLLNIDYRQILKGNIDALFVVEWNQDTEMYNHIVSTTSNDLHCFVGQVNNRQYGDTRLRSPAKESYERDVARVRGGELDYFVVVNLKVMELREFQRNFRSPSKPFKPVPTGFIMSHERRIRDLK